jgi:diguanylate cyclase (GGDEF)-like protein
MSGCFFAPDEIFTILAIDSPTRAMTPLIEALGKQGYSLQLQVYPQVSLALVRSLAPDLILVNLRASGGQGYQLCKDIRAAEDLQDIPLIFVGSGVSQVQAILALKSGGSDYLTFPLRIDEGVLRLEKHLQLSLMIRQLKDKNSSLDKRLQKRTRILVQAKSMQANLKEQNEELQRLAYVDALTQVANRRGFNQHLDELWALQMRSHTPLSLILCDVDHFKRYNDTYGHPQGDVCLCTIAEVLKLVARRASDYVARYGGEEFALILPGNDIAGAEVVAQEIKMTLAQRQLPHRSSPVKPVVSLSMGIASIMPQAHLSSDMLVKAADDALYAAKLQGRDRYCKAPANVLSTGRGQVITLYSESYQDVRKSGHG